MFLLVTYAIYIMIIDDKANCIIFIAQSLEQTSWNFLLTSRTYSKFYQTKQ